MLYYPRNQTNMAFEIVTECQCELVVEAGFNPARDILSASYGLYVWAIHNYDP